MFELELFEQGGDMPTATYAVEGMTCDHCVRAVRSEVAALDGVESVEVDLASGRLEIASTAPLTPADVLAAVDEAGYTATPQ